LPFYFALRNPSSGNDSENNMEVDEVELERRQPPQPQEPSFDDAIDHLLSTAVQGRCEGIMGHARGHQGDIRGKKAVQAAMDE